jgi:SAM-dependent methyltransferase
MAREDSNRLCRICNDEDKKVSYKAKEMLCGLRDEYTYFICPNCKCLQIEEVPNDLSKFYPGEYYSFRTESKVKAFLRSKWAKYSYNKNISNFIGALLYLIKGEYADISYFKILKINKHSRILDVGCGMAHSLVCLGELGYTDLTGVDPYVQKAWSNGSVTVLNCDLADLNRKFDVIISNWSFEHMDDPEGVLNSFKRLLNEDGMLVLRIPMVSSFAWRKYGVSWYNMDPPRHLYLHSYESLNIILGKVSLRIINIFHESNWRSLFLSYCYENNISPADSSLLVKIKLIFLKIIKFKYFNNLSNSINKNEESDLVCFVIKNNI